MVARVALVEAVCCDSAHEAAWLERNLLEVSLPPFNRTPGGQETAVYIRLDAGPMHPGLSVAHQAGPAGQVRYFGPYLGGLRVRRTVAALHRILPLPYAGAWLGGAERDLAGRAVPPTATARPSPTRSPRSWNASRPRSAGRTGNWSSCATVPPKPWPMSWRPDSGRDRRAALGQLPATGHHHGRGEPEHRGLGRWRAGPVPDPRRAAVHLVTATLQPLQRHRCASRHPGRLARLH